ncbi:MAG: metal-sulfur cluster assembly factor [Bradyrhizobium sp.]|uniref:metal-sulfur cluster assembly factor n=1 Tax=unclassified Bradyrhizobium TaxID=2631580 RepID=UPI0032E02EE3
MVHLGFVYDIDVVGGAVRITMTATTPGCPATSFPKGGAQVAASEVSRAVSVDVTMTFEPPGRPTASNRPFEPRWASPR